MLTACRRKWFLIVGAACLAAFLCVLVPVLTGAVTGMDDVVYSAISPAINPAMTWVMRKISFFASLPFVSSALLALLLLPKTRRRFGFPLSIAMLSCAAVSYTHLDVYKRQYVGRVAIGRIDRGTVRQGQEVMVCDWHKSKPVSYTHLEVYKRQGTHRL